MLHTGVWVCSNVHMCTAAVHVRTPTLELVRLDIKQTASSRVHVMSDWAHVLIAQAIVWWMPRYYILFHLLQYGKKRKRRRRTIQSESWLSFCDVSGAKKRVQNSAILSLYVDRHVLPAELWSQTPAPRLMQTAYLQYVRQVWHRHILLCGTGNSRHSPDLILWTVLRLHMCVYI